MLRQVIVSYGNVAWGMAWYRSHVMAKLVKFGLGVLWQSWFVKFWYGAECFGTAWQSSLGQSGYVASRCGTTRWVEPVMEMTNN